MSKIYTVTTCTLLPSMPIRMCMHAKDYDSLEEAERVAEVCSETGYSVSYSVTIEVNHNEC